MLHFASHYFVRAPRWSRWLATGALALACMPVRSFDSPEHVEMGREAALLAAEYLKTAGVGPHDAARIALTALQNDYGPVVACVDFFLYPEKMIDMTWTAAGRTEQRSRSDPASEDKASIMDGLPTLGHYPMEALREACKNQNAQWAQASHNNHAHFQQDLLMSQRLWHLTAIAIAHAEGEKNFYGALFVNAIADHYLQDFFAPGHIVTPRAIMDDVAATAMHDTANSDGASFAPDLSDAALRGVLNFMCTGRVDRGRGERCTARPLEGFFPRSAEAARIVEQFLDAPPSTIVFRGDGDLFKPTQVQQRVLLLAVNLLSILDVIRGENHFKQSQFHYDAACGRPLAQLSFGTYEFAATACDKRQAGQHDVAALPASVVDPSVEALPPRATSTAIGESEDPGLYQLKRSTPQVALNVLRESQSKGKFSAYNLYTGDVTWRGHVPVSPIFASVFDVWETYTSLGYAFYGESSVHGNGPYATVSLGVPETELSFGLYGRWLSYTREGRNVRLPTAGAQFSAGFSYLTLLVEGGYEYSLNSSNQLVRGRMWGGGMRFSMPVTRLTNPHIGVEKAVRAATAPAD